MDGKDGDTSGGKKKWERLRKRKDKDLEEEEEDTMELATTTTHNADGVDGA